MIKSCKLKTAKCKGLCFSLPRETGFHAVTAQQRRYKRDAQDALGKGWDSKVERRWQKILLVAAAVCGNSGILNMSAYVAFSWHRKRRENTEASTAW